MSSGVCWSVRSSSSSAPYRGCPTAPSARSETRSSNWWNRIRSSSSARGSPRTVPRCARTWRSWPRSPASPWAATETMLGEWVFGLPAGSMEEEPIIMATVAALDGCRTVGIAFEDSLIGTEYLRTTRVACARRGSAYHRGGAHPAGAIRKANGDGDTRRRQARRHRARRVRPRHRRHERRTAGDRLDAAAVHHHRVRVRVDQPMVARTARRMDRARPVRRAQRDRPSTSSTDSKRATAAGRSTSSRCTATTSAA